MKTQVQLLIAAALIMMALMYGYAMIKPRALSRDVPTTTTVSQTVQATSGSGNVSIVSMSGGTVTVNGNNFSGTTVDMIVGSGPQKTEERNVGVFASLRLEAPANVTYTVGGASLVTVSAPMNILPLVTTEVVDGSLTISIKGSVSLAEPLKVVASGKNLEEVRSMGSGKISILGVTGSELRVKLSGSGAVLATGVAGRLVADVNGSGDVDASALKAKVVEASVSGSGNVNAYASDEVRADVSGSGSIQIQGQPTRRYVEKSGSGRVAFR